MDYGKQLFNLRDRQGLTNVEMANLLKISDSLYSRYEKNKQTIPIKHLNTLCNYFGVSLDYIFNFTEIKMYDNYDKSIHTDFMVKRLKEFRKENKLSQEKLASILNVAKGTIGNYESNRGIIATPFLYTICKKYNISAYYLLGKIDSPKYLK